VALLGLGRVGSAVARLTLGDAWCRAAFTITGALVRNTAARAGVPFPVVSDARALLDSEPEVVVEVLGGIEPARSIVLAALERGIPVITANKSLLARCGDELFDLSERTGTPLRHEAAVIAGVPFLCAFSGRPFASRVSHLSAILNGTSNFILTQVASGTGFDAALDLARRLGYAEPDASLDLDGTDAAEKLTILARHFGGLSLQPGQIARDGIARLTREDLRCAGAFGGTIKPLACAAWADAPAAWVGPAFIRGDHPLFPVRGIANGICLESRLTPPLVFSGPGAGPEATAATILDDVLNAHRTEPVVRGTGAIGQTAEGLGRVTVSEPPTGWFVRVSHPADRLDPLGVADLLSTFDVWIQRTSTPSDTAAPNALWLLTHPCERARLDAALHALRAAARCDTCTVRVVETTHE
jgi:homoserine dehydrogenase